MKPFAHLDLVDRESWVDELPGGFRSGDACPKCGSRDTYLGFGLAGGGYGPYASCGACEWMGKERESTEAETS